LLNSKETGHSGAESALYLNVFDGMRQNFGFVLAIFSETTYNHVKVNGGIGLTAAVFREGAAKVASEAGWRQN